jgi:hypothetical protein
MFLGHSVAVTWLLDGWRGMCDERPVLSGRHALHQYHAVLGAARLWQASQNVCYDPAFEAGYPKTPVFDEGCRLAELWYWLWGGEYAAWVYKWGLWGLLVAIPLSAAVAAWGAGCSGVAVVAALFLGSLWTWSAPVQLLLAEGRIDGLAAGLAALVFVPHLVRFSQTLDVDAWLISAAATVVIWYCQPLLWFLLGLVVFVHYLVLAPQRGLAWHLAYAGIACIGILPNAWWLVDWGKYWWLRPAMEGEWSLPPLGWCWAGISGGSVLTVGGLVAALLGWGGRWPMGSMIALTGSLTALAARGTPGGPWLDSVGQRSLEVLSLAWGLFGILGAVDVRACRGPFGWALALAGYTILIAFALIAQHTPCPHWWPSTAATQLRLGWTRIEEELLTQLRHQTRLSARILYEERLTEQDGAAALLPLATQRWYIGGLQACLEHRYCVLREGWWLGRPLSQWSDAELEHWLRWFNIGYVVARTESSLQRWQRYAGVRLLWQVRDRDGPLALLEIPRSHNYLLAGRAEKVWGDTDRIVLEEVSPDEHGAVILSLHYQPGMRVSPGYVRIERAPEPQGRTPLDLIRLHMPGPVPHIRLSWDNP